MTDRGERSARARIRERIRAGVLDATLILEKLPPEHIQQALQLHSEDDPALETAVSNLLGMIYLAYVDQETFDVDDPGVVIAPGSWSGGLDEGWYFAWHAERGITAALNRLGVIVDDVDVDVDIDRGEEISKLGDLDTSELAEYPDSTLVQAWNAGRITDGQFADAIKAKDRDTES